MLYLLKSKVDGKYFRLTEGKDGIETVKTIRSAMFFPGEFCEKIVQAFPDVEKIVYSTSSYVDNFFSGKISEYKAIKQAEKELYSISGMI